MARASSGVVICLCNSHADSMGKHRHSSFQYSLFFFSSTRLLLFMTTSLHHPYNSIYMLKRLLDWKNGHFDLHPLHYRTLPSYTHIIPTDPKTMPESCEIFQHNNNPAIYDIYVTLDNNYMYRNKTATLEHNSCNRLKVHL